MRGKSSKALSARAQFQCPFCDKGFEQRSKLRRHTQTAHPPSAPSAADVERVLKGIKYPKTKDELEGIAEQKISSASPELLRIISSLPNRTYRDSAEVGVAFGELKSGKRPRGAAHIAKLDPLSKKGGESALKSPSISAARIASLLKGIVFPKSKRGIIAHVRKQHDTKREEVVSLLSRVSDKEYRNVVQLEREIGKVK
jgi:uncharacterized C2H2 Zn-finger protein